MAPRKSRTRSTAAPAKSPSPEPPSKQLPPTDNSPPQLLVLPEKISVQARIVSLQHPRTLKLVRFLWCPECGIFEFVKSAPPTASPSSWLIAREPSKQDDGNPTLLDLDQPVNEDKTVADGYILQDASVLLATPFDPLFLLQPLIKSKDNQARMEDDLFETLADTSKHMKYLLMRDSFKRMVVQRLGAVSEKVDIMGDTLYKPDPTMLLQCLVDKARKATSIDFWPRSLEEAKVHKGLEIPVTVQSQIAEEEAGSLQPGSQSDVSQEACVNGDNAEEKSVSPNSVASESVTKLMRLDVCLNYIMSAYVCKNLAEHFQAILASNKVIDFTELEEHRVKVQKAQDEARALRMVSENIGGKRRSPDDDEAAEARADKKRKKEEEEQKKKSESRALKDLKKADTSGMKKLSAFFAPKAKT